MVQEAVSEQTIVAQTGNQVATDLADEVVILNLATGVYYGLEDVGARIWRLIREPIAVGQIVEAILAEYDVEPDECRRDVATLLDRLAAEGLVEVQGAGAASA